MAIRIVSPAQRMAATRQAAKRGPTAMVDYRVDNDARVLPSSTIAPRKMRKPRMMMSPRSM